MCVSCPAVGEIRLIYFCLISVWIAAAFFGKLELNETKRIIGKGSRLLILIYMFALLNLPEGMNLKCVIVRLRVERRGN